MMIILSWFVVGIISMITVWIFDMRGKEFNENYFDNGNLFVSFLMIALGYFSPIIIYLSYANDKHYLTKFIYKISNIGLKTK